MRRRKSFEGCLSFMLGNRWTSSSFSNFDFRSRLPQKRLHHQPFHVARLSEKCQDATLTYPRVCSDGHGVGPWLAMAHSRLMPIFCSRCLLYSRMEQLGETSTSPLWGSFCWKRSRYFSFKGSCFNVPCRKMSGKCPFKKNAIALCNIFLFLFYLGKEGFHTLHLK